MKVVITGGAGFIGHNVALYFHSRGYNVAVIDSLERSSALALARLKDAEINVIKRDVGSDDISDLVKDSDYVVHAAAYVSVEESFEKPELYIRNNVISTLRVAHLCLKMRRPLIYLSSAAVYGEPIKLPISETHPTSPTSPYGLSKLFGENIIELYSKYGLISTILRLFNVYGPGQNEAYAGVVSKFIIEALKNKKIIIYGDGEQTRDFIHVRDVARAIELVIEKSAFNEKFNIGSGRPVSIAELAKLVKEIVCPNCKIINKPPRVGDIRHSYADITKARKVLGFEPTVTLEDGIRELVELLKAIDKTAPQDKQN